MNAPSTHGFVLPIVLCAMLAAGILVGGALNLTLNATRTAGVHTTATRCRLSARAALDRESWGANRLRQLLQQFALHIVYPRLV